jgi:hypothetical protein
MGRDIPTESHYLWTPFGDRRPGLTPKGWRISELQAIIRLYGKLICSEETKKPIFRIAHRKSTFNYSFILFKVVYTILCGLYFSRLVLFMGLIAPLSILKVSRIMPLHLIY